MKPKEEAEALTEDLVDSGRTKIVEKHENLIERAVRKIGNMREKNIVFSEIHRRMEE